MLLSEELDAARAALRVGYRDASHSNFEDKRRFGAPPLRDVHGLRALDELATVPVTLRETMRDSIRIRPARPSDAEVAAVLLYSAYTHTQVTYPLPEEQASGWIEHLRHYFRQDGNRFSYQYCCVANHNSTVVGLVLSFGGRDEPRLNAAVGSWLEREARDDEWYVDALAVLTNWGRKGIGTRLVRAAERQARQHDYPKIALHVAQGNSRALALYAHLHYKATEQTVLYQRPYLGMEKMLDKG